MEANARARLRVCATHQRLLRIGFADFHRQAVHLHHQRRFRYDRSLSSDESRIGCRRSVDHGYHQELVLPLHGDVRI